MRSSVSVRDAFKRNFLKVLVIGLLMAAWPCEAATKIRMAQPVMAMMYAPLYYNLLTGYSPITEQYAEMLTEALLKGVEQKKKDSKSRSSAIAGARSS